MLHMALLGYLWLNAMTSEYQRSETGDQQTSWLIGIIISVIIGGLLITGVNKFIPDLWESITNNINALWTHP